MIEAISERVYRWIERHGVANGKPYSWNSYAVHVPDNNAFVLVDPLPLDEDDAETLVLCPRNICTLV